MEIRMNNGHIGIIANKTNSRAEIINVDNTTQNVHDNMNA
jgi:hypothetical protein